jgi:hypothetical protein
MLLHLEKKNFLAHSNIIGFQSKFTSGATEKCSTRGYGTDLQISDSAEKLFSGKHSSLFVPGSVTEIRVLYRRQKDILTKRVIINF